MENVVVALSNTSLLSVLNQTFQLCRFQELSEKHINPHNKILPVHYGRKGNEVTWVLYTDQKSSSNVNALVEILSDFSDKDEAYVQNQIGKIMIYMKSKNHYVKHIPKSCVVYKGLEMYKTIGPCKLYYNSDNTYGVFTDEPEYAIYIQKDNNDMFPIHLLALALYFNNCVVNYCIGILLN